MPKTLVERIHEKQLFFTYTLQFSHPKLSPWCGNEEGNPAYFLSSFHKVYLYRCNYSFAATSAALCLIISFTAALLLESDCCCNLLRCSLRSLQRGTLHSESLQARAWSWSMYHIFLQRTQPPEARVLHCIPWRNSPLTFRQLGYWQLPERHVDACTRRSSIFLSCWTRICRASAFWASRSAADGWFVKLWGWMTAPFEKQALHTSKSGQTSHRQPWPVSISWQQTLHVVTNAGAVGLCRWYNTIIDECFARRSVSYW